MKICFALSSLSAKCFQFFITQYLLKRREIREGGRPRRGGRMRRRMRRMGRRKEKERAGRIE
jgi:hypothetical protein